ncbi:MAG: hypothetical protein CL915_00625 [Deltaproteobacteria bacterium]|nr:hypothetical protein [Deltaproteobacteria bacterium]
MLEKVGGLPESHVESVNYSKVTKTFGRRALPRQKGDCSWQSLRLCPLCRGVSAPSVATDHHGEQIFWGHQTHLQKGKGLFPKENETPSYDQVPI